MKILIVDDSETARALLRNVLRDAGYDDLLEAGNAEDALRMLQGQFTKEQPVDLVLMDIAMPGMGGMEATRQIKGNVQLADIPVVIVTADDDEQSLLEAFEVGATDYITKPVRRFELKARVRSALKLKQEMDQRKARESELEELTNQLTALSNQDGLTGLANRRCFDEMLAKEFLRSRREERGLCLLLFDIDYFKAYNDAYGHVMGDQCLRKVSKAALSAVRRPGDFVARYGGEEFGVLLPNTDVNGGVYVAFDIQRAVADMAVEHKESDVSSLVTVSIGLACNLTSNAQSPEGLVHLADTALYEAKRSGRNTVCRGENGGFLCMDKEYL